MKRIHLSIMLYMFSIISLIISIYQFLDNRIFNGALSLIFFSVFLTGGIHNHLKIKKVE